MSKNVWDFNFFLITNLLSALKLQDVKRIFKYFDKHHANLYAKPNHSTHFQFHKGHGFDISSLSLAVFWYFVHFVFEESHLYDVKMSLYINFSYTTQLDVYECISFSNVLSTAAGLSFYVCFHNGIDVRMECINWWNLSDRNSTIEFPINILYIFQ